MEKGGFLKSCFMDRYRSPSARLKEYLWEKLENQGLDIFGQVGFLLGIGGIAGFGVNVAIPVLYGDGSSVGSALIWFGYVCAVEILINWICIKTVDSTYNPFKHGTQPDYVNIGEDFSQGEANDGRYEADAKSTHENVSSTLRKDATAVPLTSGGEHEISEKSDSSRTSYPYFSWKPCTRCNRPRPPRAYHCPICDVCILRRDHHCFVTGVCVGYHNLRHFAVMLFWSVLATTFGGLHSLAYFWYEVLPFCSIFDLFLPLAMLRGMVFRIKPKHLVLIFMGWMLCGFFLWSLAFGRRVYMVVTTGLTSWEQWEKKRLRDSKPLDQKVKAVFGNRLWWLNFVVPLHLVFKPIEDPVNWPTITTY